MNEIKCAIIENFYAKEKIFLMNKFHTQMPLKGRNRRRIDGDGNENH